MKDCLHYLLTDENGRELPPEVVETKDGHWRRSGHKRCKCQGCLYCRLPHALVAQKKADKYLRGWHKRGSFGVQVVPTTAHPDPDEPYKQLGGQFKDALGKMRHGEVWERFCKKWGIGEWMYAMEDMINEFYGFHPHQHAMYEIVASYIADHPELQTKEGRATWEKEFQKAHYKLLQSALKKVHRSASPKHGLKVTLSTLSEREITAGVNYITKAAAELTGASSKDGKNGSRDMYALLDDVEDESLPDETRDLAGKKYVEFQKGIRNTTRYFFSESSAKETGVGESKVPELAEEPYTEVIMTLTPLQDQRLLGKGDGWPNFCTLGERCGVEVAAPWLERFCPTPQARGRPVFGEEF